MQRLFLMFALIAAVSGCARETIPNTDVDDTPQNREVLELCERYRHALEERDIGALLALASERYLDDNGTPGGADDVDYQRLAEKLAEWNDQLVDVRYEIRYQRVTS